MIKYDFIKSSSDGLKIELAYTIPKDEIKGIVQFSHGMAEHKERYFNFMEYLSNNGYVCVINDHRGHGNSVKNKKDLGYFYTEDTNFIIDDLHDVTKYIKEKFSNQKLYLFSHSMGTLVARGYIQKYDNEIEKIIFCGTPTKNPFTSFAITMAYFFKIIGMEKKPNKILNYLTFNSYNKGYQLENEWLSKNPSNISIYNDASLFHAVLIPLLISVSHRPVPPRPTAELLPVACCPSALHPPRRVHRAIAFPRPGSTARRVRRSTALHRSWSTANTLPSTCCPSAPHPPMRVHRATTLHRPGSTPRCARRSTALHRP